MFRRNIWIAHLAVFTGLVATAVAIASDVTSPWIRTADPAIHKIIDLPDDTLPPSGNKDCEEVTSRMAGTATMVPDCVISTAHGLVGTEGVTFTGASESVRIIPPNPYSGLQGVPNQGMFLAYSGSPVIGAHMHVYTSIRDKMKPAPTLVNGRWQYTLTSGPEFSLRNSSGALRSVNPFAMAISQNGNWMIVDIPFSGFVRLNMATFEMVPFAQSLNMGSDYSGHTAELTISNDGRYAAVKPDKYSELIVYDIASCRDAVTPVRRDQPKCQSRDYWPYLSAQFTKLKTVYQPRFINDSQLSFTALHSVVSSTQFKVSQHTLTAPGEDPAGIEYLGIGDSFASGQGAYSYVSGTDTANNTCHLSSWSYPFLLSGLLFSSGRSVACSGAKVRDIIDTSTTYEGQVKDKIIKSLRPNIDQIKADFAPGYLVQNEFVQTHRPSVITLSIGGNNVGFSDIVKQCVMPKFRDTTCFPTEEDQQELIIRVISKGNELKNTYRTVSSPGRTVYVIGYPQIVVEGGNCAANVHLDQKEIKMFVALTDTFNSVIRRAAESAGAQYVDVSKAFAGHRMCETKSSQVAVNGFTAGNDEGFKNLRFIGAESYHPNQLGHELLKMAILRQTNNLKKVAAAPVDSPLSTSDIASELPFADAPRTGRQLYMTANDTGIVPDVVSAGSVVPFSLSSDSIILKGLSDFQIKLSDSNQTIATIKSDMVGNLAGSITLPPDTPCGMHVLHAYGQNLANQLVDIHKVIYVPASNGDCGSDGASGLTSECGVVDAAGADMDKDGIDDACDGLISDPPTYKVYLTGTSIHAIRPE